MATSGSKTTYFVNGQYAIKFQWEVVSQSIADNTSTVNWKYLFICYRYAEDNGLYPMSFTWYTEIDGEDFSGTRTLYRNIYSQVISHGTVTMQHDADGLKTFKYQYGVSAGDQHFQGNGSGELNQILRASSLTAANGTLGTAQTLTIKPQDASYKHKIQYTCGSASGYIAGSASAYASGTSISWTPPLALAKQNTTGSSVSVALKLITYTSDGTQLGTASKTITCAIPASVKPTVSLAVSDLTDNFSTFGKYVQSKSKLKIVLTAAGSQGSTIAGYKTTVDGKSYTTASIETEAIKSNGALTISATVTDSRGRTATASQAIAVYEYSTPALEHLDVLRCNADGTANTSGAYLSITFNADVVSLDGQNPANYSLEYKKSSESQYTVLTLSDLKNQYVVSDETVIIAADPAFSYDLAVKVADYYGVVRRVGLGPSVQKVFSILKHGKGLALNKIAEEEDVFDVNFRSYFRGGIKYPTLLDEANLNTITLPNTYNGRNGGGYSNCPTTLDFTLEVLSASAGDMIVQRLTTCSKNASEVYSRFFYDNAWGNWATEQYVNKSGDTITGDIVCQTGSKGFACTVGDYNVKMLANTAGNRGLYDNVNGEWLIKKDASNVVTMNGFSLGLDSAAIKVVTTAVTSGEVAASGYLSSQSATLTAVSGYTPVAITGVQSNSSWVNVYAYWLNEDDKTKAGYSLRNYNTSAVTPKITFHVLYVKTS